MKRFATISVLVLLLGAPIAIATLPASLLKHAVARLPGVDAIRYNGSVWNGQTTLIIRGGPTGELHWHLSKLRDPASPAPFNLQPTFNWSFSNAEIKVKGSVGLGSASAVLQTEGAIDSAAIATLLSQFDIFISGNFTLPPCAVRVPYNTQSLTQIKLAHPIELVWSGGQVSYILSNRFNQVALPSLQGRLSLDTNGDARTTITPQSEQTEYLDLTLRNNGWVHIRLRRRFFDLVDQPWPGNQAADEVVMEIERQVL